MNFVDINEKSKTITPIFKINKFNSESKKNLISEIKETTQIETEITEAVGKIRLTRRGDKTQRQITSMYSKNKFSLEYSPILIIAGTTKYHLKFPLRCLFEKEDEYFIIHSEMLGIIGTGINEDDAEKAFGEEFNFIFQRFNSLNDESLTNHNLLIKNILNQKVEKVEK